MHHRSIPSKAVNNNNQQDKLRPHSDPQASKKTSHFHHPPPQPASKSTCHATCTPTRASPQSYTFSFPSPTSTTPWRGFFKERSTSTNTPRRYNSMVQIALYTGGALVALCSFSSLVIVLTHQEGSTPALHTTTTDAAAAAVLLDGKEAYHAEGRILYPKFSHDNYHPAPTAEHVKTDAEAEAELPNPLPSTYLTNQSTILITGAAGFLGSELALTLSRTYNPHAILCLDSLDSSFIGGGPHSVLHSSASTSPHVHSARAEWEAKLSAERRARTEEDLALLEYRRQRLFRVLQGVPSAKLFRGDMRVVLPEYFDVGEVPLLNSIFDKYEITHVVHLADAHRYSSAVEGTGSAASSSSSTVTGSAAVGGGGFSLKDGVKGEQQRGLHQQAVPRTREQTRAGMMETILEQIRKENARRKRKRLKNPERSMEVGLQDVSLVFASSFEVYPKTPKDKREDEPLGPPSTLHGAAKIMDELLASAYSSSYGIPSVALRFFPVYGPWSPPGSPLFEMAERAVSDAEAPLVALPPMEEGDGMSKEKLSPVQEYGKYHGLEDEVDLVYIDDAVDAILSAMQLPLTENNQENDDDEEDRTGVRYNSPVIFNVGANTPTTLLHTAQEMEKYFPRSSPEASIQSPAFAQSQSAERLHANHERARTLLGWEPRVSLEEGMKQLLSWHYDRAFPYGPPPSTATPASKQDGTKEEAPTGADAPYYDVARRGVAGCSPFDAECLRGAAVFPCASECANPSLCIPTTQDETIRITREVTRGCTEVMYTVALGEEVQGGDLPGAYTAVGPAMVHHVVSPGGKAGGGGPDCNVAFVTEGSGIVMDARKKAHGGGSLDKKTNPKTGGANEQHHDAKNSDAEALPRLMHGFWRLIVLPAYVNTPGSDEQEKPRYEFDALLPKLSPGKFFSSTVRIAIFIEPNVLISDVPDVLETFRAVPFPDVEAEAGVKTSTAMMAFSRRGGTSVKKSRFEDMVASHEWAEARQENAYNAMRVGLRGELSSEGGRGLVDSALLVHALGSSDATGGDAAAEGGDAGDDARLFRCDVYAEVLQWSSPKDETAFDFVLALHDMWSRVIVQWSGYSPWWKKKAKKGAASGDDADDDGKKKTEEEEDGKEKSGAASGTGRKLADGQEGGAGGSTGGVKGEDADEEEEADVETADGEEDEEEDSNEKEEEKTKAGGAREDSIWMGMLSSKFTYHFVRVLPSSEEWIVEL